jgi:hypothetical protein
VMAPAWPKTDAGAVVQPEPAPAWVAGLPL